MRRNEKVEGKSDFPISLKEGNMKVKSEKSNLYLLLSLVLFLLALTFSGISSFAFAGNSGAHEVFKIAFISDRGAPDGRTNLWSTNSDKRNITKLTDYSYPWKVGSPIYSNDGKWIVFRLEDAPDRHRSEIWKIKEDGSQVVLVNDPGPGRFGTCAPTGWSPDDQLILFSSEQRNHNGWFELWKVNSDGTNPVCCSPGEGTGPVTSFNSDGTKIVYTMSGYYNRPSSIITMKTDCSNKTIILSSSYWPWHYGPARAMVWTSRDEIIFSIGSFQTGYYDIYKINPDGSGLVTLFNTSADESFGGHWWGNGEEECITSDGTKLLIHSNMGGNYDIFMVNTLDFTFQQLTTDTADDINAAFSPDESKIVWISGRSGTNSVWMMNLDGSNKEQLTDDSGNEFDISISTVWNQPPVAICKDIIIPVNEDCQAFITQEDVDGGSYDPDEGDEITLSIDSIGPFSPGVHYVILTAVDEHNESDTCQAKVTVVDKTPPTPDVATLPTVTGECSAEIVSMPTATDNCKGGVIGVTNDPLSYKEQGTYTVTWTYDDGNGNTTIQTQNVIVNDITPPTIENLSANPNVLWPPNHKMVPITLSVSASDNCEDIPKCKIITVYSNEPVNGLGDGDTAPDWEITGDLTLNLRAERSGAGIGRIYTISVMCTDAYGNSSTGTVNVAAPHNKPKKN
jgi:Tol biopolymer transport system component